MECENPIKIVEITVVNKSKSFMWKQKEFILFSLELSGFSVCIRHQIPSKTIHHELFITNILNKLSHMVEGRPRGDKSFLKTHVLEYESHTLRYPRWVFMAIKSCCSGSCSKWKWYLPNPIFSYNCKYILILSTNIVEETSSLNSYQKMKYFQISPTLRTHMLLGQR